MRSSRSPRLLVALLGMWLTVYVPAGVSAGQGLETQARIQGLLSIGGVGENPIGLNIKVVKPDGSPATAGDPALLRVKADRKGYLLVIFVPPVGDAAVLFPNKKRSDNLIQPGKEYTLWGPDDGIDLRIRGKGPSGKLVVYISPSPLALDPMKIAKDGAFLRLLRSSPDQAKTLAGKLERAARDKGFNRVVLDRPVRLEGKPMNLMGAPPGLSSRKPGSTSGVRGLRDRIHKLGKE